MNNKSITARLAALENAPRSAIPKFHVEFLDGHTEVVYGATVIRYSDGVKCVLFDEEHQPSVDQIALYSALFPEIEVLPKVQ